MQPISHQSLTELLAPRRQPCISIYQPTHRASPPAEEDAVRFRDNVDRLREILSERYDGSVVRELVQPPARVWLIGSLAWGGFGAQSDVDLVLSGVDSRAMLSLKKDIARAALA